MRDDAFVSVVVALIVGAVMCVGWVREANLVRFCLAHGYPRADLGWVSPSYCIKRIDQTDVVVPVSDVEKP